VVVVCCPFPKQQSPRKFEILLNDLKHTCSCERAVCVVVGGDPHALSLSLLFAHFPGLSDIHEAPHHVAVLQKPPACGASLLRRLESSRIALLFWAAWPASSPTGAPPVECSALSNKRCSFVCTPRFVSSWGRCPQTSALPRAIPAVQSAGARPGALRSRRMVTAA
jgi:hypothetical protein